MARHIDTREPAEQASQAPTKRLGVVGLGTIGLPLATFAAARGFRVIGVDIDATRVAQINDRTVHFEYSGILEDLPAERMRATQDAAELAACDVIFFCIPTPVDDKGRIVLKHLASAGRAAASHIRPGALVVLESSVEIGTTRWFAGEIESASGKRAGHDFHLAYCPERYNPGLPTEEHAQVIYGKKVNLAGPLSYHNVARVVGGIDAASGEIARKTYASIIEAPVHLVSSVEVAEAAKLMENIFRDVNIALMNEFADTLGRLGVDTYEVIRAASSKSFAFLPHYPGLVGGECIPVDTWYLIRQAERAGAPSTLMRAARQVNDEAVDHVLTHLRDLFAQANVPLRGAKIAILGTAYKPNVFDDRVSPSRVLARKLADAGALPVLCDPVVKAHNHRTRDPLVDLDVALQDADALVLATAHKEFLTLDAEELAKRMKHRLLVDARDCLPHARFREAGFALRVWGRVLHG